MATVAMTRFHQRSTVCPIDTLTAGVTLALYLLCQLVAAKLGVNSVEGYLFRFGAALLFWAANLSIAGLLRERNPKASLSLIILSTAASFFHLWAIYYLFDFQPDVDTFQRIIKICQLLKAGTLIALGFALTRQSELPRWLGRVILGGGMLFGAFILANLAGIDFAMLRVTKTVALKSVESLLTVTLFSHGLARFKRNQKDSEANSWSARSRVERSS